MSFWDYAVPALGGAAGGFMLGGPVGALAGAGAGLAGAYSAERQNQQQQHAVDEQRAYTTNMSNTAHQREAADLRAAGLNPNLSNDGGPGASTPSSNAANVTGLPSVSFPDVLQAKSLSQRDRELDMEGTKMAAYLAKNTSEIDLLKMDKILKKKGIIRANLEGKADSAVNDIVGYFKSSWKAQHPPTDPKSRREYNQRVLNQYNRANGTSFTMEQMFQQQGRP